MLTAYQAVDGTEAQKREARFYEAGQRAMFLRRYGRFVKGDFCEITGANEQGVTLIKDGRHSTLSYRYADRITVAAASKIEIAPGDRLQLKFNGKSTEGTPLNNGELVTVRRVRKNGALVVEDECRGAKDPRPVATPVQPGLRSHILRLARQDSGHGVARRRGESGRDQPQPVVRGDLAGAQTGGCLHIRQGGTTRQRSAIRRAQARVGIKPGAGPQAEVRRERVRQVPGWTRRAWATIQRLQRQRFVQHCQVQVQEAPALQRRLAIDHFHPRMQETPKMRIHL